MVTGWICAAMGVAVVLLGGGAETGPPLLFREDWTETPAALPITQAHVANPDLMLTVHGPGGQRLKKSHHNRPADDPYYAWSGEAEATWAISLAPRRAALDLGGAARIRWRARQSGFRRLHVILRVDENTWIVSEQSDGASDEWRVQEFNLGELRWRELDIANVIEGDPVKSPNLSRVRAVGVSDLMRGGGTGASSRLDWIEVYGRAIPPPAERREK